MERCQFVNDRCCDAYLISFLLLLAYNIIATNVMTMEYTIDTADTPATAARDVA